MAPTVLSEKDSAGRGNALLEKMDVGQSIGKGTRFNCRGWIAHRVVSVLSIRRLSGAWQEGRELQRKIHYHSLGVCANESPLT
jgi:hypothetical protein